MTRLLAAEAAHGLAIRLVPNAGKQQVVVLFQVLDLDLHRVGVAKVQRRAQ